MNNHQTDKPISKKQLIVNEINAITAGLTGSAIDLVVLAAAFGGSLVLFGPTAKNLYANIKYKNAFKIANYLFRKFKQTQFREALSRTASKGLIFKIANGEYILTSEGKKYARKLIPEYKKPQKWDGQLWLVTYDIPENNKKVRNILRDRLQQIGCGMIQKSVWLSVNDPRKWLKGFVEEKSLSGLVIVSHLGRDGSVGEENVKSLISRVFKISLLEKRYKKWLKQIQETGDQNLHSCIFSYLSILKDDPVLPDQLLSPNWIGNRARNIFEVKFGNITL